MGGYAVTMAVKKKRLGFLPLALVPLAFGIQQIFEGFVWLGIKGDNVESARAWALGFLFFSHFFWPFFIPLMSYSAEIQPRRRKFLGALTIMGVIFSACIYIPFLFREGWYNPVVINCHLDYSTTVLFGALPTRIIYAVIVLAGLFGSTNRNIKIFGGIAFVSIAVTVIFWSYAFISVWCFFAAILSAYLIYVIWRLPKSSLTNF
jgi:hypothetical protein